VPAAAVQNGSVWVVGDDRHAAHRTVVVQPAQGGLLEVTSGLAQGEKIVVSGAETVQPGQLIP